VVGEKFLLAKLGACVIQMVHEGRMAVAMDAATCVFVQTFKNAFGTDVVSEIDVDGWVADGSGDLAQAFEGCKCGVPVTVGCSVFAA
jgi:hypothetical protein